MASRWSLRRKAKRCIAERLAKIRKEIDDERNESLCTVSNEVGPNCSSAELGVSRQLSQPVTCHSTETSSDKSCSFKNVHGHNETVPQSNSESEIMEPFKEYNECTFEVESENVELQTDSDSDLENEANCEEATANNMAEDISNWALAFKVTHAALSSLLKILQPYHPELPKDASLSLPPPPPVPSLPSAPSTSSSGDTAAELTFLRKLVVTMSQRLEEVSSRQKVMSKKLMDIDASIKLLLTDPTSSPSLPLNSMEEVDDLERKLMESSYSKKVAAVLAAIGGTNAKDITKRIMEKIFSRNLALQFNWMGRGEKRAFSTTRLYRTVLLAARANKHVEVKEEEVERASKSWLKFAKDREGGRKERARRQASLDASDAIPHLESP